MLYVSYSSLCVGSEREVAPTGQILSPVSFHLKRDIGVRAATVSAGQVAAASHTRRRSDNPKAPLPSDMLTRTEWFRDMKTILVGINLRLGLCPQPRSDSMGRAEMEWPQLRWAISQVAWSSFMASVATHGSFATFDAAAAQKPKDTPDTSTTPGGRRTETR